MDDATGEHQPAGERRISFGSFPELYEEGRPGYPEKLIEDVLAYAGLGPGARVLDIGAGTGQATAQFAWRGLRVHAVEPRAPMGAISHQKGDGSGLDVSAQAADFEAAKLPRHVFDLAIAPTSWHWLTPGIRWERLGEAVRPGGALAIFWNWPHWRKSTLRKELDAAYRRSGADLSRLGPMEAVELDAMVLVRAAIEDAPDGDVVTSIRLGHYDWSESYSAQQYVALLGTYADHIALSADVREQLLSDVASVIDAHGGLLDLPYTTVLLLARLQEATQGK